uniref:fibrillin-2-like n=1 Tax=Styela clava TaxID=7725 RepID=UPI001939A28D|nr:fibrillin-2-like [Styela clava]
MKSFEKDEHRLNCTDIDECDDWFICFNEVLCLEGFMYNVATEECVDIPECSYGACDPLAQCIETEGSFFCYCPEHLTLDATGTVCQDLRFGTCFWYFKESTNECSNPTFSGVIQKSDCCCTVGQGWRHDSNPCEGCPLVGTAEFDKICPLGKIEKPETEVPVTGNCFLASEGVVSDPFCSNSVGVNVSRATCCCSPYGRAWGENPCEICPWKNTYDYQTVCPGGYGFTPNRITVSLEDIDECIELPGLCQGGKCVNTYGSFICECPEGYELNEESRVCEDLEDSPTVSNTLPGRRRIQTKPDYGIVGRPGLCQEVPVTGNCFLTVEGDEKAPTCSDGVGVDVSLATCCCSPYGKAWRRNTCEICPEKITIDYQTVCPGGYGFTPNRITMSLEDIDECMELPGLCQGGKCGNVLGSFICECPEGYKLNEESRVCEVPDPGNCFLTVEGDETAPTCSDGVGVIVSRETCCCIFYGKAWGVNQCEICPEKNTDDYQTVCPEGDGFTPNRTTVYFEDIDECMELPDLCQGGKCVNVFGSFICECPEGYALNEARRVCVDLENSPTVSNTLFRRGRIQAKPLFEVKGTKIDPCDSYGRCWNGRCIKSSLVGLHCECNQGYKKVGQGLNCIDIDECDDVSICIYGECVNLMGSYMCQCPRGTILSSNGVECIPDPSYGSIEDPDDCRANPCKTGDQCVPTDGGRYRCTGGKCKR